MLSQILNRPPKRPEPSPVTEKDKELAKRKIRFLMQNLNTQMERFHTAPSEGIREDAYREIKSLEAKVSEELARYGLVAEDFK